MRRGRLVRHVLHMHRYEGSIPSSATNMEQWSSWFRTLACHARERGFESLLFRLCDCRLTGKTGGFQPSNLSSSLSGRLRASLAQLEERLPCK